MKCADPKLCYRSGTKAIFRHFSQASPQLKAVAQTIYDCGTCPSCRKKRSRELAIRCVLHASLYLDNSFLTLTYDEKMEGYKNVLQYKHIQDFKRRLRRQEQYHYNKKIQIFNVHEYGKNGKKHWHLVCFNYNPRDREIHSYSNGKPLFTSKNLQDLWPFGFSTCGDVNEASAMYQAQYTQKDLKNGNITNGKKSKSNHSGIGKEFFLLHYKQILSLGYIPFNGKKIPVPRYFQKLAHKHWCHFNDFSYFIDLPHRKKLYTLFKHGEENKEISDLYSTYRKTKDIYIEGLAQEWDLFISGSLFSPEKLDSKKSEENFTYDLYRKTNKEIF